MNTDHNHLSICGTCARHAEATSENEGYSDCCNDRIAYGEEAAEIVAKARREGDAGAGEDNRI